MSIYLNMIHKTVYIASDGGRVCRPLLVVENGKHKHPLGVVVHGAIRLPLSSRWPGELA